ncbi:hypothetical protein MLD38_037167 [Melastoma candidum]|uniref:Uncharacterized protein n=1 Tax=Melastoma candidum TaxID=119954 RepID=A0ACB9LNR8_9MYRT|nr:hypothetical protein MLD38_037167 [Melastoma candidum]
MAVTIPSDPFTVATISPGAYTDTETFQVFPVDQAFDPLLQIGWFDWEFQLALDKNNPCYYRFRIKTKI